MITLLALLTFTVPPPLADTVFINGKIWTGDAAKPEARALAVMSGKILRVGTNDDMKEITGPETKTVDLKLQRVVPGFYDSHVHLLGGGFSLSQVDLKDAKDEAEFGKRLKEYDAKLPKGRWIIGGNWDHDRAFNGIMPTAAIVDKYVKDRPVFISRYDGHMALANSAAMALAKIGKETSDVPGGVIFRDGEGKPNGVFKDNAMGLIDKIVPEADEAAVNEAFAAALKALAASGITSVQDMDGSSAAARKIYLQLLMAQSMQRKLTVRIDLHRAIDGIAEFAKSPRYSSDDFREAGVKGFMDGSLGSSTAKMSEPYTSDAKTSGVYVTEPDVMRNYVKLADAAKMIVAVHAIGDQANSALLDIFKDVAEANGPRDRHFRIEHAQHLKPSDYARFKELNVIASMQPYHVNDDGRWAEGRIGVKRCESSYAYRSLLDAGAPLAFGSDWPVAPLNVFEGIDAAVNRRPLDGKHPGGWFPKQKITVEEAVRAYTAGSAYAGGHEKDRGKLARDYFADFVVISRDIFDPKQNENIKTTTVMTTVMNGKIVFER